MKQPILGITEPFPSTFFKHQLTILQVYQIHFHKHSNISGFTSIHRPLEFFLLYLIFHSMNGSSNFQKTCNLSLFSICVKESNRKYWDKRWRSLSSEKWCHWNTIS